MEYNYKANILPSSFSKVQISYQDLMYASQNLVPTHFRIYLYIIGHPNRIVTREELRDFFNIGNDVLYEFRNAVKKIGAGDGDKSSLFTCFNTIWGEDKPYEGKW